MPEGFPFQVDLSTPETLVEQLATGISHAIRQGLYRPGERLPTIRGLAARLGIGESTVRAAYRRLSDAGEVVGRTRLGSVVTPSRGWALRGRVLIVMTDLDINPQMCVHLAKLRTRLQADGYLVSQVMVLADRSRRRDYRGLEQAQNQGIDFIVLLYGAEDVERHLSGLGVPFYVVGNSAGAYLPSGCVGRFGLSSRAATAALAERCAQRGVRKAEIIGFCQFDGLLGDVVKALRAVDVETLLTPLTRGYDVKRRFDGAFACGFQMATDRVASPTALPDLVFVTDDFVATGYLHGLAAAGVRLPEDLGFACYSNGGAGPYFSRPVTTLEADNYADGDVIAARVSDYLCRQREFPNESLSLAFRSGETF